MNNKKWQWINRIVLVVLGMICCVCMSTLTAEAKKKTVVEKRIEQVRKEYPNKSKMNELVGVRGFTGGGCNALVMYTTLRVFHNSFTPLCDTYKTIGTSASTNDIAAMKRLFAKAKVGDVVRFRDGNTDAHYAIFLSSNKDGAYFYESNFGGKNIVRYNNFWSWSVMKTWPTGGATKVDIYRAKNYDKVNKGKSAKLYKKGDKINVDDLIYQVTKVSGFGGEVKFLGFEEGSYSSHVIIPSYIYVDNMLENGLNCNYENGYGDTQRLGVSYQMIYKVTAIGDNALDVINDDDEDDDEEDDEDDNGYEFPELGAAFVRGMHTRGSADGIKYDYVRQVTIGKNVTTIGSNAFRGVKKIIIKSKKLKKVSRTALIHTDENLVITVPSSKYKAYKKLLAGKGQSGSAVIKK